MTPPIDRRTFLALGVGAVAWTCARGGDSSETEPKGPERPSGAISVLAGAPALAVGDTRQSFVILRGQRPIAPDDVRARLVPLEGEGFAVEAEREQIRRGIGGEEDHEHPEGTEVEDIFVIRHDFDRPGPWEIAVTFNGGSGSAAFQIVDDAPSPMVDEPAIASKSPTRTNPREVDPICTRRPACSMHDVTIADAVASGKPLVIVFATPRFCTSRACGPVVDIVEAEKERVGRDVNFVHIEVWANDEDAVGSSPSPTFAEWKFDGEPWTYFVGADGKVTDRWLGPVGRRELRRAIDGLVEG